MTITEGLASSTWTLLPERPVVLVPIGSFEQHGPHLPLDTDTAIASAVTERVALKLRAEGVSVVAAPAITYGSSGEHQSFAGTISIGHEALVHSLIELVRSLTTWSGPIVFINAHGGNGRSLNAAVDQLTNESRQVTWVPCATEEVDAHAGYTETSILLYLNPSRVQLHEAQPGNTAPIAALLPEIIAGGVQAVSANGVLGDPSGANAAAGEQILAEIVERAHASVSEWLNP